LTTNLLLPACGEEPDCFYLYNRLEERIYEQHKIIELISEISDTDLDKIISEILPNLRPYRFLRYVCNFSYRQIAEILNVPLQSVEPKLAMVNNIIEVKIWEKFRGIPRKSLHEEALWYMKNHKEKLGISN